MAIQWGGGGGMLRQPKFAVVNFAMGNFAEPPGLSGSCPRQSPQCVLVCTASVREIHGQPGISRGKFRGQFETQNFPCEIKVPRNPPPPPRQLVYLARHGAAHRSTSAPHTHVLVCICSNVRQFQSSCFLSLTAMYTY